MKYYEPEDIAYQFLDTEDTIRPTTPAEDRLYDDIGADYALTARALLTTCFKVMSRNEIDTCQTATGDFDDDYGFDACVIDRLANQFAKEIAEFKNKN